jgi:hypothetical protein
MTNTPLRLLVWPDRRQHMLNLRPRSVLRRISGNHEEFPLLLVVTFALRNLPRCRLGIFCTQSKGLQIDPTPRAGRGACSHRQYRTGQGAAETPCPRGSGEIRWHGPWWTPFRGPCVADPGGRGSRIAPTPAAHKRRGGRACSASCKASPVRGAYRVMNASPLSSARPSDPGKQGQEGNRAKKGVLVTTLTRYTLLQIPSWLIMALLLAGLHLWTRPALLGVAVVLV